MKSLRNFALLGWLLGAGLVLAPAQNPPGAGAGTAKATGGGFSLPLKRNGRIYVWFKGSGTESISTTLMRIRDFKVETFNEDETPALVGEAPECVLNLTSKNASSAGPIKITQSGGRFTHAGEGFSWDHEAGRLVLSNRVHSTVRMNPFGRVKK